MVHVSYEHELKEEKNITVEVRLFNISTLIDRNVEKDAVEFLHDLQYLINKAQEEKYSQIVISQEEVDYNYYEMFLVGKRQETDEEKDLRLSNLKLREDFLKEIQDEIVRQTNKPVEVLTLPHHTPTPNENAIYWFNSRGIGMFKVVFPDFTKFQDFNKKLNIVDTLFNPNTSIYQIKEIIDGR